ncbi:MAG: carboxylate-amine ligase [bacterium]
MQPALTIGIEEEYLLVDPISRDLVVEPPANFMADCKAELGSQVTPEFLKCQVEIGTPVCETIKQARHHLTGLRSTIIRIAEKHDLAMIAASTHPFGAWQKQQHTELERYEQLDKDMKGTIRRMLICGMHVHAGIEDEDLRIDLMNQIKYFLPHLLALSASSPFWQGDDMGLKSSRLTVFDGMPRTGLPDYFESYGEYDRLVRRLVRSGIMEDSSKIWWDLRPSARFPTLEMRITDVCTRMEDALTVAAIYQALLRYLSRLKRNNQRWRHYPRAMIQENRWIARRFGITGRFLDLGKGVLHPFCSQIEDLLDMLKEDARALDCEQELEHARVILKRGSSACGQIKTFNTAIAEGDNVEEALKRVVDYLIKETAADLPENK